MYSILGYRLYPFYDFNGRKLMKDFWISSPGSRSWKCHQLIESAWFLIFNDVKNKILLKICSKSRFLSYGITNKYQYSEFSFYVKILWKWYEFLRDVGMNYDYDSHFHAIQDSKSWKVWLETSNPCVWKKSSSSTLTLFLQQKKWK